MSNLKLQWMADELHDAGLNVVDHDGWKTRTATKTYEYTPVGVVDHHTAGSSVLTNYPDPPFWSNSRLEFACNITIRPNAEVCVLNAGVANDSGMGDQRVLDRLRRDEEPTAPVDFTASDRVSGNPWFIDIEVQHKGDGSPIHRPQYDALIVTNAVICNHYGWNPLTRVIGHREWTLRKVDPRWSGTSNPMYTIRQHTLEILEDLMDRNTEVDNGLPVLAEAFNRARDAGVYSEHTKPGKVVIADELAAFLDRAGVLNKGARTWTNKQIIALVAGSGAVGAGADELIAEIVRRLSGS